MRKTLFSGQGFLVTVSRYAPRERHGPHRDQNSRVSLVLQGGFREEAPAGTMEMGAGGLLVKSHTVRHEDSFGEDGALLLAVEFCDDDNLLSRPDQDSWRKREDGGALRASIMLAEAALARDEASVDAACADLVCEDTHLTGRCEQPPSWLLQLKDEVENLGLANTNVAMRAREAGVHPSHASRLFRRTFQVSITEHAQTHAVRRALALMSRPDAALSEVALGAGFYDQSHMNRTFRRISGRAPGAYRTIVARVDAAAG